MRRLHNYNKLLRLIYIYEKKTIYDVALFECVISMKDFRITININNVNCSRREGQNLHV